MFAKAVLASVALIIAIGCNQSTKPVSDNNPDTLHNKMINTNNLDSTSGYADVNGIHMYYELHGAGHSLVLIHGGGSTIGTTFGNILPALAKKYRVLAVELQAHGHSSDRGKPSSFEQDADDVAALLSQLKIEKASIFGFSNGGNAAMQLAIRHPAQVDKLVVASAFYQREGMLPGFFEGMKNASLNNMPAPLQTAFLAINSDHQALQLMHDRDKERMIQFKDWSDADLRAIKAPTLLLAADHDVVLPEHQVKMSRLIPNTSLLIVPGTHGSYIGEICAINPGSQMPEQIVAMVTEFLGG